MQVASPSRKRIRSPVTVTASSAAAASSNENHKHSKRILEMASTMDEFMAYPMMYQPRTEWLSSETTTSTATATTTATPTSSSSSSSDKSDTCQFGSNFDPPVLQCLKRNAFEAADRLIHAGASVNAFNAKRLSPLILASQRGLFQLCLLLLEKGAHVHHVTLQGTTAVLQAAHYGHLQVLTALLQAPQNRKLMELANHHQTTPLMRAAQEGHGHICQWLLQQGALVNRKNHQSMTALMLASQRGHADVVKVLIDYGADVDARTEHNSTALVLAVKRSNTRVVHVLVEHGCELALLDSKGRTPLYVAQYRLHNRSLANLLVPERQVELIQAKARKQYVWQLVKTYTLLQQQDQQQDQQQQRAMVRPGKENTLSAQLINQLPLGIFQKVVEYVPFPCRWEERIGILTKRSVVDTVAAICGTCDVMDEVLEQGGFCTACDEVEIAPPPHDGDCKTWMQWKAWCRQRAPIDTILSTTHQQEQQPLQQLPRRIDVAQAQLTIPSLKNACMYDYRRHANYLQILARSTKLQQRLTLEPYRLSPSLIQQLVTIHDLCSLVRRTNRVGLNTRHPPILSLEPSVAMDVILLTSRLCSWYSST